MTKPATADAPPFTEYQLAWGESMARALQKAGCGPISVQSFDDQEIQASSGTAAAMAFWLRFVAAGALRGELALFVSQENEAHLIQTLKSNHAEPKEATAGSDREALAELFRNTADLVKSSLAKQFAGEVQMSCLGSGAPTWPPAAQFGFRLAGEVGEPICVGVQVSAELSDCLRSAPAGAGQPANVIAFQPEASVSAATETNLNLLKDAELEVTLRFGQREMYLREVFELAPGAVVELDRQIQGSCRVIGRQEGGGARRGCGSGWELRHPSDGDCQSTRTDRIVEPVGRNGRANWTIGIGSSTRDLADAIVRQPIERKY